MSNERNRDPKGIPSGGQYAAERRLEPLIDSIQPPSSVTSSIDEDTRANLEALVGRSVSEAEIADVMDDEAVAYRATKYEDDPSDRNSALLADAIADQLGEVPVHAEDLPRADELPAHMSSFRLTPEQNDRLPADLHQEDGIYYGRYEDSPIEAVIGSPRDPGPFTLPSEHEWTVDQLKGMQRASFASSGVTPEMVARRRNKLEHVDRADFTLNGANFSDRDDLVGANFSGTLASNTPFGSHMPGATFRGASLWRCSFTRARAAAGDFRETRWHDHNAAPHSEAVFSGASFKGAQLDSSTFINTSFDRADFSGATLNMTSIMHSEANEASFKQATIRTGDFSKTGLVKADFSHASVTETNFNDALMVEANFSHATLNRCDFRGCDLERTNLRGATFTNCDLRGVDLGPNATEATFINCQGVNA